jgi:polyhydroxybutyrate depolymerase
MSAGRRSVRISTPAHERVRTPRAAFGIHGLLLAVAVSGDCIPSADQPEAGDANIFVNGQARSYRIFEPSPAQSAGADSQFPLVLAFHGGGGTAAGMQILTGLDTLAEREGFFVAYPQGLNNNWNDGRPGINENVDDVEFVRMLLDELLAKHRIDANRICATGISNGGHFCHRLAFDLPGRFAAIAPVAAALSTTLAARPHSPSPIAVLMIFGDADPIAPYGGGTIRVGTLVERGEMLSVRDAARYWAAANGATAEPEVSYEPDTAADDGTRARREVFSPEFGGPSVVVLTIEGGGHTWPGGVQYLPEAVIGRTSRDLSAGEVIWDWFRDQQFPKPERRRYGADGSMFGKRSARVCMLEITQRSLLIRSNPLTLKRISMK